MTNKGSWSRQEDEALFNYITTHGEGKWQKVAQNAGLRRCGKSCRQRWLNYLKPGIKRGDISSDEEDMIIRLHRLLGNRWALIAKRLPGRTDNEIKNYWNSNLSKKLQRQQLTSTLASLSSPSPCLKHHQKFEDQNVRKNKEIFNAVAPDASRLTGVTAVRLDSKTMESNGSDSRSRPSSSNQIEGTADDHALSNFVMDYDDQIDRNQIFMPDGLNAQLSQNDDEEQNKLLSEKIVDPLDYSINLDVELKRVAYFLGLEDECT